MRCPNCGSRIRKRSHFCKECGSAVVSPMLQRGGEEGTEEREAAAGIPPVTPASAAPALGDAEKAPGESPGAPDTPRATDHIPEPAAPSPEGEGDEISSDAVPPEEKKGGGGRMPLIVGAIVFVVMVAVTIVLLFTVFGGEDSGTGKGDRSNASPAVTVRGFLDSLTLDRPNDLLTALDPQFVSDLNQQYGEGSQKLVLSFFRNAIPKGMLISDLKLEEEINGDQATVKVVGGTATYEDETGQTVTSEVKDLGYETFDLVKKDDSWYISATSFPTWKSYLQRAAGKNQAGGKEGSVATATFESASLGARISYPTSWSFQEREDGAVEFKPIGKEGDATVTLERVSGDGQAPSLEAWSQAEQARLDAAGTEYKYYDAKFGGNPAARFVYSFSGEGGAAFRTIELYTVVGDAGFLLEYTAPENTFFKYKDVTQIIARSFEVL